MRPASYRGLRKSHKNMLEWPKIAFPPPKNRTTLRENTSTLLEATGTARIAPGGAALAPAARCSPGPEYSAKNEMLSCIKTRFELLPSLTSLGSWARMSFWEEIPHLGGKGWSSYKRVSLPDEKKRGSCMNRMEESISWVTEFCPELPKGTNSHITLHRATKLLQQAEAWGSPQHHVPLCKGATLNAASLKCE